MVNLYEFVTLYKTHTQKNIIHKVTGIFKSNVWGKLCKYPNPVKTCGLSWV